MSTSRLFFYILLGFLSGILLHSFFISPVSIIWIIAMAVIVGAAVVFWRTPYFLATCLVGIAFLLGLYRFEAAANKLNAIFVDNTVNIKVASEVTQYPKSYQFVGENSVGRFWVIAPLSTTIQYGDVLQGDCRFERIAISDQYFGWYASKGTSSVCFLKHIEITKHDSVLVARLFEIKNQAIKQINQLFANERGALLGSMIFGGTRALSKEAADNFRSAGLTHLVAISGYNFSLLIFFVMSIFEFLYIPRRVASIVAIILTVLFFMLVGPSASAARAVLMSGLILLAKMIGRQRNLTHIFTVVAATLLALNPLSLRYDAGFVLSFVATGTLLYAVSPVLAKLEQWLRLPKMSVKFLWWPVKNIIKTFFEIVMASSLIMIATAPVLWFFFGRVSLASVLSNALVGPIVPFVMMGGYILTVVSFISLPLAEIFVWPMDLLLHYIIGVANFLA